METKAISKLAPEGVTWIRAAVASIPMVGSALDHLIFDKADAIRLKNLETAIAALSNQINGASQGAIDKKWFETEEALATFKVMADKVSYEPDKRKVDALGRIVAACGTNEHSKDDKKLSVVEHLSRLSATQIKILAAVSRTAPQQKKISTGGLEQTATAIWITDVMATLKSGPQFWTGTLKLDEELEVLESYNTLRRVHLMGPSEAGFVITSIGKLAASYVRTAGL